jgi:hypothetical protein
MRTVNISAARAQLSRLVESAAMFAAEIEEMFYGRDE